MGLDSESPLAPFPLNLPPSAAVTDRVRVPETSPTLEKLLGPDDLSFASPPTERVYRHGDPKSQINLVFLSEGYSAVELSNYREDVRNACSLLFETEPFCSRRTDFNVFQINSISRDSGIDGVPSVEIRRNTAFGLGWTGDDSSGHFTALRDPRYYDINLDNMTRALRLLRWREKLSPWDLQRTKLILLVNRPQTTLSGPDLAQRDGQWIILRSGPHPGPGRLLVHALGHALGGLHDEYVRSISALDVPAEEPPGANLTRREDVESPDHKWHGLLRVANVLPCGVPLNANEGGTLGAVSYSRGVWRPTVDGCVMHAPGKTVEFCLVCQRAVVTRIDSLAGRTPHTSPPRILRFDAPVQARQGGESELHWVAADPKGERVRLSIDWNDSEDWSTELTPWAPSHAEGVARHRWSRPGPHRITLHAIDLSGCLSEPRILVVDVLR